MKYIGTDNELQEKNSYCNYCLKCCGLTTSNKGRFYMKYIGTDIELQTKLKNDYPLHFACIYGHTSTVAKLLENGADVNAKTNDVYHWTALVVAIKNEHTKTVKMLLDAGADVNAEGYFNDTALHFASEKGNKEIVAMLLEKKYGADVNKSSDDIKRWKALHFASYYGHTEIVEMLLENGADVNAKGYKRRTALHFASDQGHTEIVALLQKYNKLPDKDEVNEKNDNVKNDNEKNDNVNNNSCCCFNWYNTDTKNTDYESEIIENQKNNGCNWDDIPINNVKKDEIILYNKGVL
jgi:ankyrin repeat protein